MPHPVRFDALDADAARLLGKLLQDRHEPKEAIAFYQDVIVNHPGSAAFPLSLLGRGVCRVEAGEKEPGLVDLNNVVRQIEGKTGKPARVAPRDETLDGLHRAQKVLVNRSDFQARWN